MKPRSPIEPGELQLKILQVLWRKEPATVAEVHQELSRGRICAYTTIATVLRRMEAQGLVTHREEGRSYWYSPSVREDEVSRSLTGNLLDRMFRGSVADMVSHLLSTRDVDTKELATLEKLIAKKRREQ